MKPLLLGPRLTTMLVGMQVRLWHFGWVWLLGTAVAVLAAALQFVGTTTTQTEAELTAQLAEARAAQGRSIATPQADASLQDLQLSLTNDATTAELIRQMVNIAASLDVAWTQGEYSQKHDSGTGLLQIQIVQPVKTQYPRLKGYVERVLRTFPNASLEQIVARRESVTQTDLDVRLRWSFWLYAPPAHRVVDEVSE